MIVLAATMKAKAGKEGELENTLKTFVPMVEGEKGTAQYVLHRSRKDAATFFFYEKYIDQASMDFHCSTPYLNELLTVIEPLLAEAPALEIYDEVAAIQR